MAFSVAPRDELDGVLDVAAERGRVCALAMACFGDLSTWSARHPALFPADPFGPSVFGGIALAMAFGSPGVAPGELRTTARTVMWAFGLDRLVDHVATERGQVEAIVDGCEAVAGGAPPPGDDPLLVVLAQLRDELAARDGWAELAPVWREELGGYLAANLREWDWKTRAAGGAALPSFEEYLANADNIGATFVNVTHWVDRGTVRTAGELRRLAEAGDAAQRVLRLVNDLASHERDQRWGDLNGLMLGVDRAAVTERIAGLTEDFELLAASLATDHPEAADHLRRQVGFSTGFYGVTDYWGTR
jgi:hypothetical protein